MDLPSTVRVSAQTRELIEKREALQSEGPPQTVQETSSVEAMMLQMASHPLGARCEVSPGGRRGQVCFVGRPGGLQILVAVELDMSQGDDVQLGSRWLDGIRYFEPSREDAPVVWAQPKDVVCGDFPELDPFADLSDTEQQ
ncbi:Tubulin-folding cofactor B (AtTFCB) (Protein EMBRYO DEFECTIVE 2804) [Durusdinium trenchii]|uniref:Tubulin-folding cofactor B (AtTFCB) (Protein EMBRYO DEFECTIVE 2804) n=1 Tax=Durusdinium trenchii TaxID=1381693 RepID=A0ABP0M8G2_9DINO